MKIQPARFTASDGKTTLAAKVATLSRHIAARAKQWPGTQDDYNTWAVRSMEQFFEQVSIGL